MGPGQKRVLQAGTEEEQALDKGKSKEDAKTTRASEANLDYYSILPWDSLAYIKGHTLPL